MMRQRMMCHNRPILFARSRIAWQYCAFEIKALQCMRANTSRTDMSHHNLKSTQANVLCGYCKAKVSWLGSFPSLATMHNRYGIREASTPQNGC